MDKGRILVVDDSPTHRQLITKPLKDYGYQIVVAKDGEEALEKVNYERPDLIVLDVIMPKKNGFQVCRQLKAAATTKDIKIIILTSKDQVSDRFWGLRQGADEYLTKPFDDQELLANVVKFLG